MNKLYRNWFVHNMFAHPMSEMVYWVVRPWGKKKAEKASDWVHDLTIPTGNPEGM